jgi:predicted O-linked N-acetylglucosamine transferase (SPINDLY family)
LWRSGRRDEAQQICEALGTAGDQEALSLLAEMYTGKSQLRDAAEILRRLAWLKPTDASVHRRLGDALLAIGSFAEAAGSYRSAVVLEPGVVRGHNNLGQALMRLGRHAEAIESYQRAIELDPNYAIAHNNLGIAYYEEGHWNQALACYQRALELDLSFAEARNNCGNTLLKLNRPEEALGYYEQALTLKPALFNRGKALQELKRFEAAVESYEKGLQVEPHNAEALSNCASALLVLHKPEEALRYCERAIALKPDFPEAYNNLGGALRRLGKHEEAVAACEMALQLKPEYSTALSNLASIMVAYRRFSEAIEYCDRALAVQPLWTDAHEQRGAALLAARRPMESALAYARLVEIDPERKFARGMVIGSRLAGCDWTEWDADRDRLIAGVRDGKEAVSPFTFLAVNDSPELHVKCARIFADDQIPRDYRLPWSGTRHEHDRIRIAYVSADYHQHATAMLMAGMFEAHDRQKFETIAISLGRSDSSPMRRRLEPAFDRFIDVQRLSDAEAVKLMRSMEIDIAVDLKGWTGESRAGLFARRSAPIQVNYLGYPGSMGLAELDYILADRIVLPPQLQVHCTEAVVYLPDSYQVNDDKRVIDSRIPTRSAVGLPDEAFVFCCFNNNYKLTPEIFAVWVRILQAVPGSVLWLLEDNPDAARNLRREAQSRDMSPERLVFAPRMTVEAHLARHRLADLFLDTLPYNAHTTSSDALWAGLPVLTCLGAAFPGRVAASLLHAVGLPELVTQNLDQYAALAIELAGNPERLRQIRERLAHNRTRYPLFDTVRFCRHVEAAYTQMWERYRAGLAPVSFEVPALPVTVT